MDDVRNYLNPPTKAPMGRGFFLKIGLNDGGLAEFYNRQLMKLVEMVLTWQGKALWARVDDAEGRVVVSTKTMDRLWAAVVGCYGTVSEETPFMIHGPTLTQTSWKNTTTQIFLGP